MTDAANNSEQESIRLRTLLQAFEVELQEMGKLAETAQTMLSSVLLHVADDPLCHRDAQVLDLLTQRLYGMSGFLTKLAPSIPRVWQVNTSAAVATVTLASLADRLNGVAAGVAPQDIGELEMF